MTILKELKYEDVINWTEDEIVAYIKPYLLERIEDKDYESLSIMENKIINIWDQIIKKLTEEEAEELYTKINNIGAKLWKDIEMPQDWPLEFYTPTKELLENEENPEIAKMKGAIDEITK